MYKRIYDKPTKAEKDLELALKKIAQLEEITGKLFDAILELQGNKKKKKYYNPYTQMLTEAEQKFYDSKNFLTSNQRLIPTNKEKYLETIDKYFDKEAFIKNLEERRESAFSAAISDFRNISN